VRDRPKFHNSFSERSLVERSPLACTIRRRHRLPISNPALSAVNGTPRRLRQGPRAVQRDRLSRSSRNGASDSARVGGSRHQSRANRCKTVIAKHRTWIAISSRGTEEEEERSWYRAGEEAFTVIARHQRRKPNALRRVVERVRADLPQVVTPVSEFREILEGMSREERRDYVSNFTELPRADF